MIRPLPPGVLGSAQFCVSGELRVARYRLDRWWEATLARDEYTGRPTDDRYRPLVVIGMNPSQADGWTVEEYAESGPFAHLIRGALPKPEPSGGTET